MSACSKLMWLYRVHIFYLYLSHLLLVLYMFMKIAVVSEEVTNFLSDIIPVMLMILATYMQKFIIIRKNPSRSSEVGCTRMVDIVSAILKALKPVILFMCCVCGLTLKVVTADY